jgi:shikimate kinase
LYLAGFMGTGKSAAGRIVAERLHRPFFDLDELISTRMGRSIRELFAGEGEPAFRLYEIAALKNTIESAPAVIALGGGAPTVPAVCDTVKRTGIAVLLTANWQAIWNRLRGDDSRPLLAGVLDVRDEDSVDSFERFVARATPILEARVVSYDALTDYTIDTSALSLDDVADRILAIVKGTSVLTGE